jgi:hypothetical protein
MCTSRRLRKERFRIDGFWVVGLMRAPKRRPQISPLRYAGVAGQRCFSKPCVGTGGQRDCGQRQESSHNEVKAFEESVFGPCTPGRTWGTRPGKGASFFDPTSPPPTHCARRRRFLLRLSRAECSQGLLERGCLHIGGPELMRCQVAAYGCRKI